MRVCIFSLLGFPPFETKSYNETYEKIKKVSFVLPEFLSPEVKDLLKKILVYDRAKRLDLPGILAHPWIIKHNASNNNNNKS